MCMGVIYLVGEEVRVARNERCDIFSRGGG